MSMLRRYLSDPKHMFEPEHLEIQEDLTYIEHLIRIVDRKEQVIRNKVIPLVMVI